MNQNFISRKLLFFGPTVLVSKTSGNKLEWRFRDLQFTLLLFRKKSGRSYTDKTLKKPTE